MRSRIATGTHVLPVGDKYRDVFYQTLRGQTLLNLVAEPTCARFRRTDALRHTFRAAAVATAW
ncbi:hypothetical protein [uncultured Spirosoma sp.]|uniref:hypothetical protein n=1 Tax=uncultured Spirosoma sp. TaxID=278208 RepID=UPI002585E8B2|nr:hypothetical protein [uncultured Spirosoma sp.]